MNELESYINMPIFSSHELPPYEGLVIKCPNCKASYDFVPNDRGCGFCGNRRSNLIYVKRKNINEM